MKTVYDQKSNGAIPLLSTDGSTLLTDIDAILERWEEQFNSVFNRPLAINENVINRLRKIGYNALLDEYFQPSQTQIQHMSSGKAPGADAIPTETY